MEGTREQVAEAVSGEKTKSYLLANVKATRKLSPS